MGKVTQTRRRTRRELQKVRQEALAAKQRMKKSNPQPKQKVVINDILKDIVQKRNETKNGAQVHKKGAPKIVTTNTATDVGFYQKGYKGAEIKNDGKGLVDKTKQARIEDDVLYLMNGNNDKISSNEKMNFHRSQKNYVASDFMSSPEVENKNKSWKCTFNDPLEKNVENNVLYKQDPHKFSPLFRRNRLDVKKDETVRLQSQVLPSEPKVTLKNVLEIKELSSKIAQEISTTKIGSQSSTLREELEFLRTTCRKSWMENLNNCKQKESIEIQECSGTTTQSIICNALFPELKDSRRHSAEATPKKRGINFFQSGSSISPTPFKFLFTPLEKSTQVGNKIFFPSSILRKEKSVYYRPENFENALKDRFPIDMSFSTRSLKAMSIDSDDDEVRVMETKPVKENRKLLVPEKNNNDTQNIFRHQTKSKYNNQAIFTKEFIYGGQGTSHVNYIDKKSFQKDHNYTKRRIYQPVAEKKHEFAHTSYYNAELNVDQNMHEHPRRRLSSDRSSSRSDERNFASTSRLSSGDEKDRAIRNIPRQKSHRHGFNNHDQYLVCLQNASGGSQREYENHKSIQLSPRRDQFVAAELSKTKNPTIVVVMPPCGIQHMDYNEIRNVSRNACQFLSQGSHQHPGFSDSSAVCISQPSKFLKIEEDKRFLKKPIYLNQEEDQTHRKVGRVVSMDGMRPKQFCCNRMPVLKESDERDVSSSHRFHSFQRNQHVCRNQDVLKSRCKKLQCCCDRCHSLDNECEVRPVKHCSQPIESSRYHRHDDDYYFRN